MKVNKILLVFLFILFALLLIWPVWMILAYVVFSGAGKVAFILGTIAAEILLGAFLLFYFFKNKSSMGKIPFFIGTILIGLSYIGYLYSLVNIYFIQK